MHSVSYMTMKTTKTQTAANMDMVVRYSFVRSAPSWREQCTATTVSTDTRTKQLPQLTSFHGDRLLASASQSSGVGQKVVMQGGAS